ncbi:hypothetical protein JCM6294_1714 [Bacteroides pyogenes DSM 20611 = JCM 6294]|uniref:Uncharacterized protein n=1 Tax=Bacteroides pyogenes DSM 20611 = JCM 6294 TaxID=1121100 RepID=W4PHY1_9BACE|nr:hypothetical protein JCM6294_1714 [Bacteroides pyogenes DSM 20611 = JCM 6294]
MCPFDKAQHIALKHNGFVCRRKTRRTLPKKPAGFEKNTAGFEKKAAGFEMKGGGL